MASDALIEFIAAWEGGPKLVSSEDRLVPGVYDVGYGRVIHSSDHPMKITRQQAEDMLREDVAMIEEEVAGMVTVPTLEHEFEALVSFAYNVGTNALRNSTMLERLNSLDYDCWRELARWNKAGGRIVHGLVKRRAAEYRMAKFNDYSTIP